MEQIYNIFPNIKHQNFLDNAYVLEIAINRDKTAMNIVVLFAMSVSIKKINSVQNEIKKAYELQRVTISQRYKEIDNKYLSTVKEYFIAKHPSTIGFLKDSTWEIQEKKLIIKANSDIKEFFSKILTLVSNYIYDQTGQVFVIETEVLKTEQTFVSREEILKESIENQQNEVVHTEPKIAPKTHEEKPRYQTKQRKQSLTLNAEEEIIFGKPTQDVITPIEDIMPDMGNFLIKGDIFYVEIKEIPNRDLYVIKFDVTDYSSSVRVTKLFKKDDFLEFAPKIKVGLHVKVQGLLEYNNFEKEHLFKPLALIKSAKKERMDFAKEKRVELHLHTNMSSMDGINSIKDYIKVAKKWGHKAIAVTDHGIVQAFPEAMNAGKGAGIKIIYGVEGYVYDDLKPVSAVKNVKDYDIDDEVVIFDLETTGLRHEAEEIIEISAEIFKKGNKISEYHTYVDPKRPISEKITELTGITDEIVEGKKEIKQAIVEFVDFVGDRPLVAHNADFDMGFINFACNKFGIDKQFTSIDTLEMSRIILSHMTRHRLNTIAKALGLGSFEHHRASEDTRMLALIYSRFINRLKDEHNITNVNQINDILQNIHDNNQNKKPSRTKHLIILVKNYVGLKNLYKIVSSSHLEHFYSRPVIPKSLLNEHREGLIIGSACESGELFSAILYGENPETIEKIVSEMDYLEIQPIGNNKFLVANETVASTGELMRLNEKIVALGEKYNKPVVATGDVHFLNPQDEVYRRILMASKGFSDADDQAPLYFKTTEEMLEEFSYLGDEKAYEVVVTNTNLIADMCEEIKAVPSETYPPTIDGSAEELERLSRIKAQELYGENPNSIVIERLEYELKSIIGNGFDVMYMIAQKLVSKSIEEGYLVGSRGSVGSSFVAFLSGITEVNSLPAHYRCPNCKNTEFYPNQGLCGCDMEDKTCPVCNTKYIKDGFDIPFATFLGFDGDKAPDIDLNFSGEYQEKAHKHTEEIFGKNHVFRAGTIGTVASKTAYGFVKKYFDEREISINRAEENRLSVGCTGVKRTTGQHPGGLMIVPKDKSIYDFCPVQHPADDQDTTVITTHFDYHSIHDNLLKLDLLGHDDPTIIKQLYEITGINPQNVPLDDPETMRIFTDIGALGIEKDKILGTTGSVAVPEFGTKFVREMLNTTQPKTFDELVRISGLSHGTDVWLGNAHELVVAGVATLKEIICARDDIMNFLIAKGLDPKMSFTIMESVRKGKGLNAEWEDAMHKNNVPDWYINSCKKIKYMFPKAHAVAYVMMAFRIAWFKVHHPIAFYSAYFSVRAKSFDASIMTVSHSKILAKMDELNKKPDITQVEKDMLTTLEVCHEFYLRGFKFLPIDIYKSDVNRFLIEDGNALRPPFTSMPGLGESAAYSIIEERQKEKFISVEELQMRCTKVSKTVIEQLESTNALENIPKTTQISIF